MLKRIFDLARPALLRLEPERAHEASLRALELGVFPRQRAADDPVLAQSIWGRRFPNPLGIAAGYDKDARVADALLAMGMGFAEIGTVTPRAQDGNPRPRVFRLPENKAVINRLGFNNAGHGAALVRLRARALKTPASVVGVNIGANKDSADRAQDYVDGIEAFAGLASYFVVNVSSPNTPGLRDLQAPEQLDQLLTLVLAARDKPADATGGRMQLATRVVRHRSS